MIELFAKVEDAMKTKLIFPTISLLILVCCVSAHAQTNRYVGVGGDDANPGTIAQPLATIAQALALSADTGDTVSILPGTYSGTGNQDLEVSHTQIVIKGADEERRPLIQVESGHDGFHFTSIETDSTTSLESIHILGEGCGARIQGGAPHFSSCLFDSCDSGIYFVYNANYPAKTAIRNCLFQNCQKGIHLHSSIYGSSISHCTFSGGGTGIYQPDIYKDEVEKDPLSFNIWDCVFSGLNYAILNSDSSTPSCLSFCRVENCTTAFFGLVEAYSSSISTGEMVSTGVVSSNPVRFENCTISGVTGTVFGVHAGLWYNQVFAKRCLIENCNVIADLYNATEGYAVLHLQDCILRNNAGGISASYRYVSLSLSDCVYLNNGAGITYGCRSGGGLTIDSCTFANITGDILHIPYAIDEPWGPKSSITLMNSILAHATGVAFHVTGEVDVPVTITDCDFFNNSGGDFVGWDPPPVSDGNFYLDPKFEMLPSGDILLAQTSPCRPINHPESLLVGASWSASVGDSLATCSFSPPNLDFSPAQGHQDPLTNRVVLTNTSGNTLYQRLDLVSGTVPFDPEQYSVVPDAVILDPDASVELALTYKPSGNREAALVTDHLQVGITTGSLDLEVTDDWFYLVSFPADTIHFHSGDLAIPNEQTLSLLNEAGGDPVFSIPALPAGNGEFTIPMGPFPLQPGLNSILLSYVPADAGNDTLVLSPDFFSSTSGGSLTGQPTVLIGHGPQHSCVLLAAQPPGQALVSCDTSLAVDFIFDHQEGTVGLKGYSIRFSADPNLGIEPGDVTVHSVPEGEMNFFQVTSMGDNDLVVDYAIMGAGAPSIESRTTLFTVQVAGVSEGVGQLRVVGAQLRDAANQDFLFNVNEPLDISIDCTGPEAVSEMTAGFGNSNIALTWSPPGDSDLAEFLVFRGQWLDGMLQSAYPLYNQGPTGSQPPQLIDLEQHLASDRWHLLASLPAGATSFVDTTSDRGVYFYQVFSRDAVLNGSAAPDTLLVGPNYLLGDVALPWDGSVDIADLSALGDSYRTGSADPYFNAECDVGPTGSGSYLATPIPDGQVEFEDLMIFGLNYGRDKATAPASRPTGFQALLAWRSVGGNQFGLYLLEPCPGLQGLNLVGEGPGWGASHGQAGDLLDGCGDFWLATGREEGLLDLGLVLLDQPLGSEDAGQLLLVSADQSLSGDRLRLELRDSANKPIDWAFSATSDAPPAPDRFSLSDNFPNPFNPETSIHFSLPHATLVQLKVFGVDGRMVRTLVEGRMPAGHHETTWDGRDRQGAAVSSGMYFFRLEAGGFVQTKKMLLMK